MNDDVKTWLVTAVGTLGTAVLGLWKLNESKNTKAITDLTKRAEDCETDRRDLRSTLQKTEVRLAVLEDRVGEGEHK